MLNVLALRANDREGVDDALRSFMTPMKRLSYDKNRPGATTTYEVATPLHLAVQCAPTSMVEYILSKRKGDLLARDKRGNTVLHLAAHQGRDDVVALLLQEPDIDDSIANNEGKQVHFS